MKHWVLASILAFLGTGGLANASNILINGGFDNEPNFIPPSAGWLLFTGSQIPGWTIASGHGATVHRAGSGNPTISGGYTVNMDGEGYNGHNALLYQDFASINGGTYQLDFNWESWDYRPSVHLEVMILDTVTSTKLFDGVYSYNGFLVLNTVSTTFTGTGHTLRLLLQENPESGYNDNGFLVDNFSVSLISSPVPEPTGVSLLGMGVLGIAGLLRLRRKSQSLR